MQFIELKIYTYKDNNVDFVEKGLIGTLDLPMDKAELREQLTKWGFAETETAVIVCSYECDLEYYFINEATIDVFELNECAITAVNAAKDMGCLFWLVLDSILEGTSDTLKEAIDHAVNEDFLLVEDESLETIADMLIEDDYFGEIPRKVIEFIDFELVTDYLEQQGCIETIHGVLIPKHSPCFDLIK